jgi:nucleotide-binding universal stress UspA family protein
MFEKVLVPVDFSPYARAVLECVGDIPGVKEAVLMNVVTRPTLTRLWDPVTEVREAEKKLEEEKKYVHSNVVVKTKVVSAPEGEIPRAIQKVASEENSSLVVLGARGKSIIESAFLGSVTRNVLRFGDNHLLIMRYKTAGGAKGLDFPGAKGTKGLRDEMAEPFRLEKYCDDLFSMILIPTDFSQPEAAAITFLKGIPGMEKIHLLHVVSRGETREEIEALVGNAEEKLKGIALELAGDGRVVSSRVVIGNPVEQIRIIAEEEDVSLIAMSSVGKDTMYTGRIGSRTYDVANTARRPVLVVRMKPIYAVPVS